MTGYMRAAAIGTQGCGKTLTLVWLGKLFYDKGVDVYSNFEVKFPHKRIESPEEIDDIRDGFGLLDDLGLWIDSRLSGSKKNRLITTMLGHSRKSHFGFAYSSQVPTQVDLRIRYVLTHVFLPHVENHSRVVLEGYKLDGLDWLRMTDHYLSISALGELYDTDARIYGDEKKP